MVFIPFCLLHVTILSIDYSGFGRWSTKVSTASTNASFRIIQPELVRNPKVDDASFIFASATFNGSLVSFPLHSYSESKFQVLSVSEFYVSTEPQFQSASVFIECFGRTCWWQFLFQSGRSSIPYHFNTSVPHIRIIRAIPLLDVVDQYNHYLAGSLIPQLAPTASTKDQPPTGKRKFGDHLRGAYGTFISKFNYPRRTILSCIQWKSDFLMGREGHHEDWPMKSRPRNWTKYLVQHWSSLPWAKDYPRPSNQTIYNWVKNECRYKTGDKALAEPAENTAPDVNQLIDAQVLI